MASKVSFLQFVRSRIRKDEALDKAEDAIVWWSRKIAHLITVAVFTVILLSIAIVFCGMLLASMYGMAYAGMGVAVLILLYSFIYVVYFAAFWVDQPSIIDNDELFDMLETLIETETKNLRGKIDTLTHEIDFLTLKLEGGPDDNGNR